MEPNNGLRVVFTGDISFSRFFETAWKEHACFDDEVSSWLQNADHVVANMECPLTDRSIQSSRALNHAGDPAAGGFAANQNIRVWSLANNHIMDCTADGLFDTLRTAAANGCSTVGAGENLSAAAQPVILGEEVRVAVISVANTWKHVRAGEGVPGALTWDRLELIRSEIEKLRSAVDWIVLVVHGGDEYCDLALPFMRRKYRMLLDLGADIIVGHHPHVVQNYELPEKGKAIFYSLGNFLFDTDNQRLYEHTEHGVLLEMFFTRESFTFRALGTEIDRTMQVVRKAETVPVFTELTEQAYSLLWPLVAKKFYRSDLLKRKRANKRLAKMSRPLLFVHELLRCRRRRWREVQWGRFLSCFRRKARGISSDLAAYLD